jgi:bifunctional non-homologous end joining protein LigD
VSVVPVTAQGSVAGTVAITNADKIWWPAEGLTKLDVARYYAAVAERLLPWTIDRPLTVERCPDGFRGRCFYQKNLAHGERFGIPTRALRAASAGRIVHYPVGDDARTLLALVNLGTLAFHLMNCRAAAPERPDWVAWDLDPPARFADAVQAALVLREILEGDGLRTYVKTTGGKGVHVLVPLRPGPGHAEVAAYAHAVSARMVARAPALVTETFARQHRGGRVYIDIARNVFGATIVAPYSVRHRPHAPVSTPLAWSDLVPTLDPSTLDVRTALARLDAGDPWGRFWSDLQPLPAVDPRGADERRRPRRRRRPVA